MKIEFGNLKSKISTDNPDLINALVKLYTFKVPGAEFSPSYKRKQWDGTRSYITKAGYFKSGLLSRILGDLDEIGCSPEITGVIDEKTVKVQQISEFTYYDFQETFINRALSEKRGIVKSPTASGKTLIMAGIIQSLLQPGRKMVLLFNAKQLLIQTHKFLTEACNMKNIGICFGEGFEYGDIMLSTVQSIDKILDTHLDDTEVLIVDEVHEFANGKMTLAAINSFPSATFRFGFTATPPPDDIPLYNLEGAFGPIWEETSTSSLVADGKLSKPIIQLIRVKNEESTNGRSYSEVYDDFIVNNEKRNKIIHTTVNHICKTNKKARVLILTKNLQHANTLHRMIENSHKLWGDDDITTRYKTISQFLSSEDTSVLIGTKILQTGINIEEITHFINARGLKSEIATLQALGRALRKHDSKKEVYIYDFIDDAKYLKKHSKERKKHYIKEGHTVKEI